MAGTNSSTSHPSPAAFVIALPLHLHVEYIYFVAPFASTRVGRASPPHTWGCTSLTPLELILPHLGGLALHSALQWSPYPTCCWYVQPLQARHGSAAMMKGIQSVSAESAEKLHACMFWRTPPPRRCACPVIAKVVLRPPAGYPAILRSMLTI